VERARLRQHQIFFTYLHLAPDLPHTEDLVKSGAICIGYESVSDAKGGFPLVGPLDEDGGRRSILAGAQA
ncbi:alanine dehydrogenase, partial [Pseudoalteromonas ruthenica]